MTEEAMVCPEPESELLPFLAAGTLSAEERSRVLSHVAGCERCREELRETAKLTLGLRALHLTPDEVVAAAAGGARPTHLDLCPACQGEVTIVQRSHAELTGSSAAAALASTIASPRFSGGPRRRVAFWAVGLAATLAAVLAAPRLLHKAVEPEVSLRGGPSPSIVTVEPGPAAAAPLVRFRWLPAAGVDRYEVRLYAEDGRTVWKGETANETSLTLPVAVAPGRYRWLVTGYRGHEAVAASGLAILELRP